MQRNIFIYGCVLSNNDSTYLENKLHVIAVIQRVHVYFLPGFDFHLVIDIRYIDIDDEGQLIIENNRWYDIYQVIRHLTA